jgi:hypothetical protein
MMTRPTEGQEIYEELAEQCRWEADRTLDREAAQSLRMLAERYERLAEAEAYKVLSRRWQSLPYR